MEARHGQTARPASAGEASTAQRFGAVVLGVLGAIWGAAVIAVLVDLADTPTCDEIAFGDCFDGSRTAKTLTQIFGWPAAIAFVALLPLGVYFAATRRLGTLLVRVLAVAVGLGLIGVIAARL